MRASLLFRRVQTWLQSTQAVKDDAGVALVAIVFVIGSAALVGTTAVLMREQGVQAELREVRGQRANYDRIQDALEVFALRDFNAAGTAGAGGGLYRLPCPAAPADDDGVREVWDGSNTCGTVDRGIVPWASIGLAESEVIDEQGNYITYIVQDGTMEACNGSVPNTGSLDDLNSTTDYSYVLIGHGENGFGAFSQVTNAQLTNPSSAQEQANCQADCDAGAGTGFTANEFRSGPASDDITSFFDDIVRPVQLSENFTVECEELFQVDDETAVSFSLGVQQIAQNFTVTSNDADENTARVNRSTDDKGTTEESDDESTLVFDGRRNADPTSSCAWFEPPVPMQNNSIRILTEFAAASDSLVDGRGNGVVFAFMSYDPDDPLLLAEDGSGYTISDLICGGTDSHMGFADEEDPAVAPLSRDTDLPDVPRFGVEVDTHAHGDTFDGEEASTTQGDNSNQDPTTNSNGNAWNHIAVIGSNNDHEGNEQDDTGDGDDNTIKGDGPVCEAGLVGTHGAGQHLGDGATTDDLAGCFPDDNTLLADMTTEVGMIEVGDTSPADGDFHQMRIDLNYEGGSCGTDEVLVSFWVFLNSDGDTQPSCASTPGEGCEDLTQDYTPDGSEDGGKSFCVPWRSDFNDAFMRFGFTSGRPATNTDNDLDFFTIRGFDLRAIANSPPDAPTTSNGTQSREIYNVNVAEEIIAPVYPTARNVQDSFMGVIDMNDSSVDALDDIEPENAFNPPRELSGVRLIARNGVFDAQFTSDNPGIGEPDPLTDNEGIGIRGIGSDSANEIDMFWERSVDVAPTGNNPGNGDLGTYPNADNPEARESIEVRFYHDDDSSSSTTTSYERVSFNLSGFRQNSTPEGDLNEKVIVRAFNRGRMVGDEQIIDGCSATANNTHMFLSLDYTGTPVDTVILIPEILTTESTVEPYEDDQYGSDFYIRGIQGCDDTRACGLLATSDCVTYQGTYPYGALGDSTIFNDSDQSGVVTLDNLQEHFNPGGGAIDLFAAGDRTNWLSLEEDFDLAATGDNGPVYMDVIALDTGVAFDAQVQLNEDGTDTWEEGFYVDGNNGIEHNRDEIIEFWFPNTWDTALLAIGDFGEDNTGSASASQPDRAEQIIVSGFSGSDGQTLVDSFTVVSCGDFDNDGADSDDFGTAHITVRFASGINRLRLEPSTWVGGTNSTNFVLNGIRMCTFGGTCDFGTMDDVADNCTGGDVTSYGP